MRYVSNLIRGFVKEIDFYIYENLTNDNMT